MATGAMRWDVRDPLLPFADRFVLTAGHCIPLIYSVLAVVNHVMELRYQWTGDEKYKVKGGPEHILSPEDLLTLRFNGGLPGHAEFAGKSWFIKFNTGPSGHGAPAAAGIALALKHAGLRGHQRLRHGRRRRPYRGYPPRDKKLGLWPWAVQPHLHDGLERLRHRPRRPIRRSSTARHRLGSRHMGSRWMAPSRATTSPASCPTLFESVFGENPNKCAALRMVQNHQGPRLWRHRLRLARRAPRPQQRTLLENAGRNSWRPMASSLKVTAKPLPTRMPPPKSASHINTVKEAMAGDKDFVEWLSDRLVAIGDSVPRRKTQQ